jgi:hypothetical protein
MVGYTEVILATALREVIEANRRGTWTINAVTGHVGTSRNLYEPLGIECSKLRRW